MPGPNSTKGTLRKTKQWVPPNLKRRIEAYEAGGMGNPSYAQNGLKYHKPGSQKR